MASEEAELRREFEIARRDLDEMDEEIAAAEDLLRELARHDHQVGPLRDLLGDARQRHGRLLERERALRAKFDAATGETPDRTH